MTEHEHDDTAARLRAALRAEADMVQPSGDGLHAIRREVADGERARWQHPAALAVAAAVVLGLVMGGGAALLGGDDGDGDTSVVASDPSDSPSPPEPSPPGPASQPPSGAPTPVGADGDVYVYYVMDDPDSGPRLYREVHAAPAGPPAAAVAVQEMLSAPPTDPDYSSPWPAGTMIKGYDDISGDTAIVDLSNFVTVGSIFEVTAVQQLVHTVTANDPAVQRVRLLVNGETPQSGHADWSEPVARAPMLDAQGLIWLLSPTQGEQVTSPVTVTGYGTAFEGTVSWDVRAQGSDEVVAEGFAQAGANGEFDDFSDAVELEPGSYVMRAFESSAEDGRPIHVDSKSFTVAR